MKINIFEFDNYKEYIKSLIESYPKKGRGQYKKIADHLRTSTVSISQIFKGERHLSSEYAFMLTRYLGLDDYESNYFLQMVDMAKASHFELKSFNRQRLKQIKEEARKMKARVSKYKELKDEDKAIFYSDTVYSRVRLASSLDGIESLSDIAKYLDIPIEKVNSIANFLVNCGLCKSDSQGKISVSTQHSMIKSDSPFIKNHHSNWRLYSVQKSSVLSEKDEIMFSLPMSLSHSAYEDLQKLVLSTIKDAYGIVSPAKDEHLAYLGIDLYRM